MGAEDFRISLTGGERNSAELGNFVAALPGVAPDPNPAPWFPDDKQFLATVDDHIIEILVDSVAPDISCRFALCHPRSIDDVFADFVMAIASALTMRIEISAEVPAGEIRLFNPPHFDGFRRILHQAIEPERQMWKQMFGDTEAAVTTGQAIERFIMPDCIPPKEDTP